ncbi:MAG TPA: RNA polymerase sigma factor RpoD, partial [Enterococcus sp.]|nr:RNA polymerase sigma factor RpoD [Enterococcus sp.]
MAEETKKTYDKAVAEYIRENKTKGQVVYDDITNRLATP